MGRPRCMPVRLMREWAGGLAAGLLTRRIYHRFLASTLHVCFFAIKLARVPLEKPSNCNLLHNRCYALLLCPSHLVDEAPYIQFPLPEHDQTQPRHLCRNPLALPARQRPGRIESRRAGALVSVATPALRRLRGLFQGAGSRDALRHRGHAPPLPRHSEGRDDGGAVADGPGLQTRDRAHHRRGL
jgi:hypothetical protein